MISDSLVHVDSFCEEIRERARRLSAVLIQLESQPENRALLEEAFRESHTIKGLAGVIENTEAARLSHRLEDVFDAAQKGSYELTGEVFNVLLCALDWVEASLEGPLPPGIVAEVEDQVHQLLQPSPTRTAPAPERVLPPFSLEQGESARQNRRGVAMPPHSELIRVSAEEMEQVASLARDLELHQKEEADALRTLQPTVRLLTNLEQLLTELSDADESRPRRIRGRIHEIRSQCREIHRQVRGFLDGRERTIGEATQTVEMFQQALQHIQYVPLSALYELFPRMVRDMAQEEGKEVHLRLLGGEIRVERSVLEQIRAPLVHLIRNAISHGIEKPTMREALGKSRVGTITVDAYQAANKLCIEVSDDGAGIDPERLRQTAKSRGMSERESDSQNDEEAIGMIFRSGFSTCTEVSGFAGRGVGLDLVRSRLAAIQGAVWVISEPGRGATFVMEVPA